MVILGRTRELSSTYQSFDDDGSYLDLSRARSDESIFWSAGEEAAMLVAELKASLVPSDHNSFQKSMKSHSFSNLSTATFEELDSVNFAKPPISILPNSWGTPCAGKPIFGDSAAMPIRKRASITKSHKSPGAAFPPHSPRNKGDQMKSFGGSWRSLLRMGSLSTRGKPGPCAKKVPPPTVPDTGNSSSASSTCSSNSSHRHSGSSFSSGVFSVDQRSSFSSSIGEETNCHPPPSPSSPGRDSGCEPTMAGSITSTGSSGSNTSSGSSSTGAGRSGVSSTGGKSSSPSHYQNSQFTFPTQAPQFAHLMCPKPSGSPHHVPHEGTTYPYQPYTQQVSMEDQGIDVQSPGRSSPGSGSASSAAGSTASSSNCRNSTTSLDSGRASSSTQTHTHRLSGQSYDSNSILRHSCHSSSSSIGSVDHDSPLQINVHELLSKGVPDTEVLRLWLSELHFEEYLEKFVSAGYDLPTIFRMTPEDLNAIGITKPAHRKRIKFEISRLNITDGLPDFIPSRLEEWFSLLRLENYLHSLKQQKYTTVQQVTQITWEDLEDFGITKLGHQKKLMLAIKRVKDIMAGKKINSMSQDDRMFTAGLYHQDPRDPYIIRTDIRGYPDQNPFYLHHNRIDGTLDPGGQYRIPMKPYVHNGMFHQGNSHTNQNFKYPPGYYSDMGRCLVPNPTVCYRPDIVAVNFTRPGPVPYSEDPIYGTCQTFLPPGGNPYFPSKPMLPLQNGGCQQRSFDDGDITPTNENTNIYEGGGTLPRPRTANKYRPVAKVTAKTRVDVHEVPAQFLKQEIIKDGSEISCSDSANTTPTPTPQGTPKKIPPPPPPKRSNSLSENSTQSQKECSRGGSLHRRGLSYSYMGVKNSLQPDVTPDMPPPPPAPQDRGNHQHLPEDFPPPPPPLTCITMASTATRTAIVTSVAPNVELVTPSTYNSESDIAGFRPRRNESNSSFKSTSSSDSGESLPFANDNAGTIKQRVTRPHPSFPLLDSRSPRSSPLSSPALRRKEGIVLPTVRSLQPVPNVFSNVPNSPLKSLNQPDETSDVLSDIGNMLANLTDELDAMLEQEMALKKQTAS